MLQSGNEDTPWTEGDGVWKCLEEGQTKSLPDSSTQDSQFPFCLTTNLSSKAPTVFPTVATVICQLGFEGS